MTPHFTRWMVHQSRLDMRSFPIPFLFLLTRYLVPVFAATEIGPCTQYFENCLSSTAAAAASNMATNNGNASTSSEYSSTSALIVSLALLCVAMIGGVYCFFKYSSNRDLKSAAVPQPQAVQIIRFPAPGVALNANPNSGMPAEAPLIAPHFRIVEPIHQQGIQMYDNGLVNEELMRPMYGKESGLSFVPAVVSPGAPGVALAPVQYGQAPEDIAINIDNDEPIHENEEAEGVQEEKVHKEPQFHHEEAEGQPEVVVEEVPLQPVVLPAAEENNAAHQHPAVLHLEPQPISTPASQQIEGC